MDTVTHVTETATGGEEVDIGQSDDSRPEKGREEEFYDAIDDNQSNNFIDSSETKSNMGRKNRSEVSPSGDVLSDDKCTLNNNTVNSKPNSNSNSNEDLFISKKCKNSDKQPDHISKQCDAADLSNDTTATGSVESDKLIAKREKRKRDRKKRKKNKRERESNEDGDEKENSLQKFDSSETDISEKDEIPKNKGQKISSKKKSYDVSAPVTMVKDGSDADSSDQLVSTSSDLKTESREISSDSDLVKSESSGNEESYDMNCDINQNPDNSGVESKNADSNKSKETEPSTADGGEKSDQLNDTKRNKNKDSKKHEKFEEKNSSTDDVPEKKDVETEKGDVMPTTPRKKQKSRKSKNSRKRSNSRDDSLEEIQVSAKGNKVVPEDGSKAADTKDPTTENKESSFDEGMSCPQSVENLSEAPRIESLTDNSSKDSNLIETNDLIDTNDSRHNKASKEPSPENKEASSKRKDSFSDNRSCSSERKKHKGATPEDQNQKNKSSKKKESAASRRKNRKNKDKRSENKPKTDLTGGLHPMVDSASAVESVKESQEGSAEAEGEEGGSILEGQVKEERSETNQELSTDVGEARLESNKDEQAEATEEISGTNQDQSLKHEKDAFQKNQEKESAERDGIEEQNGEVKTEEKENKNEVPQETSKSQFKNKDNLKELFEGEGEEEGSSVDPPVSKLESENQEEECKISETKDNDSLNVDLKEEKRPEKVSTSKVSLDDDEKPQKTTEDSGKSEPATTKDTGESIFPAVHTPSDTEAVKSQDLTEGASPESDAPKADILESHKESTKDVFVDCTDSAPMDCVKFESEAESVEKKESTAAKKEELIEEKIAETVQANPEVRSDQPDVVELEQPTSDQPDLVELKQPTSGEVDEASSKQDSLESKDSCNVEEKEKKDLSGEEESKTSITILDESCNIGSQDCTTIVDRNEDSVDGAADSCGVLVKEKNEVSCEQESSLTEIESLKSTGIIDGMPNIDSSFEKLDNSCGVVEKEKVLESSASNKESSTTVGEPQDCVDRAPISGSSSVSEIPKDFIHNKETEDSVDRAPIYGPSSVSEISEGNSIVPSKDNNNDIYEVKSLCSEQQISGVVKDISVTKEMKDVAIETEEDEEKIKMKEEMDKLKEEVESTKAALKQSQSHLYRHQIHTNLTITSLQAQLRKKDLEMKSKQVVHDNQISAIISKLFLLEGQLRQEQKQILGLLELKETVIDRQSAKIEDLSARNDKLSIALKLHNNGNNGLVQSINRSTSDLSPTNHKLFKEKDSPKNTKFWGSMKDKLRRHKSSFELHTPDRLEPLGEGTFRYGSQENLSNISRRQRINDRKERCRSIAEYPQGLGQSPLLELPNENDFQKCDSAEAIIIHAESNEETGLNSSDDNTSQLTDPMGSNMDVRDRSGSFASQQSDQSSLSIPVDAEIVNVDKPNVQSSPTIPVVQHSESNPFKSIKTMLKRKGSKLRNKKRTVNLQTGTNQEQQNDSVKKHFKKFDMQ